MSGSLYGGAELGKDLPGIGDQLILTLAPDSHLGGGLAIKEALLELEDPAPSPAFAIFLTLPPNVKSKSESASHPFQLGSALSVGGSRRLRRAQHHTLGLQRSIALSPLSPGVPDP